MYWRIVLLFCIFVGVKSSLIPNIKPCRQDDIPCFTNSADILYNAAIKGVPGWNIKTLDPVYHNQIDGKFATVNYKIINSTVVGLKNCHVFNAQLRLEKNSMKFELVCPDLYMYGIYEISGIIIIVPIEGNGDFRIDCKDYHLNIDTEVEITPSHDGKRYLKFKNFQAIGDLRGGMVIDLKNLFNGQNQQLADAALKFVNDYWKPVATLLQAPVINANIKRILKNLNKYLRKLPFDQIIML